MCRREYETKDYFPFPPCHEFAHPWMRALPSKQKGAWEKVDDADSVGRHLGRVWEREEALKSCFVFLPPPGVS